MGNIQETWIDPRKVSGVTSDVYVCRCETAQFIFSPNAGSTMFCLVGYNQMASNLVLDGWINFGSTLWSELLRVDATSF
jgi:hypothetical protein